MHVGPFRCAPRGQASNPDTGRGFGAEGSATRIQGLPISKRKAASRILSSLCSGEGGWMVIVARAEFFEGWRGAWLFVPAELVIRLGIRKLPVPARCRASEPPCPACDCIYISRKRIQRLSTARAVRPCGYIIALLALEPASTRRQSVIFIVSRACGGDRLAICSNHNPNSFCFDIRPPDETFAYSWWSLPQAPEPSSQKSLDTMLTAESTSGT